MIPIKPHDAKFTDGQWRAIYEEGHNILVSASAGSGKTTVLTQRIVEKLKRGVSIDALLVVTYTELAAREMRERIEKAVKSEINQTVDAQVRKHLQQQLLLLPQANISTIHAFCLKLIRQYFHLVHIDPVFRLMTDEIEINLLKEETWQNLKEELYDTPEFVALAKAYASDKYDDRLTNLVFSLYEFSRANENPTQWLENLVDIYDVDDLMQSVLFQTLIYPDVRAVLMESVQDLEEAIDSLNGEPLLTAVAEQLIADKQSLEMIQQQLTQQQSFTHVYQSVQHITFDRWKGAKSKDDAAIKEMSDKAKSVRDRVKKQVEWLQESVFYGTEEKHIELLKRVKPFVQEMAHVVMQFSQRYQRAKEEANVLEFSDLEHIALEILAPLQSDGSRVLSQASQDYQVLFQEVMVDEYQDVNRLQESIIQKLSNGHNLFMVGDVKQSIYAFRLADPSLFLEKYTAYGQGQGGQRIILAENFRSRGMILHATNFIFQQLMDSEVGQMDYDEAAMLKQGNMAYGSDEQYPLSVLLYEQQTTGDHEVIGDVDEQFVIDDKTQGEVSMVAKEINRLIHEQLPIYENGVQRPIQYKDIVLLVPTKKNNVVIQEVFEQYRIPVKVTGAETYFQRTEMLIMLSVLKLIDNPYQDIPLVSVLRSPIVGLDENDLAAIRINERTGHYFQAVLQFVTQYEQHVLPQNAFHQNIYDKLKRLLSRLDAWRFTAHKTALSTLIWDIYQDTHFLDYVIGLPSGLQRQANLHALYEHAKTYEQTRFKGLFQFIKFIELLQAKEKDLAEEVVVDTQENAVALMTIHASKGLEFPVVFVMDMAKKFNKTDVRDSYIFTEEHGVGTDYFDAETKWRYPTLVRHGMSRFKEKKLLAEEMRKLYVALTRAKEKVYVVGSCQDKETFYTKLEPILSHPHVLLPTMRRLQAPHFLEWVSMALVRHTCFENNYLTPGRYPFALQSSLQFTVSFDSVHTLTVHKTYDKKQSFMEWFNTQTETNKHCQTDTIQDIVHVQGYQYPYLAATQTTGYQSASELKRLIEDPDIKQMASVTNRYVQQTLPKPSFMMQSSVSAADIGTATHIVMQTMPLQHIGLQSLQQHIDQLVATNVIDKNVAKHINTDNILRFYASPLGQVIQHVPQHVKREVPFSMVMQADKLFKDDMLHSEDVLIHGIVDGYIDEDDGIVLYDFKTDIVDNATVLTKRYAQQLKVYAHALNAVLGKPIKAVYICSLHLGENIVVDWSKNE